MFHCIDIKPVLPLVTNSTYSSQTHCIALNVVLIYIISNLLLTGGPLHPQKVD